MTTVDKLLLRLIGSNQDYVKNALSKKDFDTLSSMALTCDTAFFVTENQSKLIVKILQENHEKLPKFSEEILKVLSDNTWSKPFRRIEQVRKLYISKNSDQHLRLCIEFTFSSQIKKILANFEKSSDTELSTDGGKLFYAALTEKNIVSLVEALTPHKFEIEETIKNHYDTIKSWSKSEIENQYIIENIENSNFFNSITRDLGDTISTDNILINDRSLRYQFFTKIQKNHGDTLSEYIANRITPRIWIDKNQHSLTDVFESLIELKRLPLLIIFENLDDVKNIKNLKNLSDSLEKTGIDKSVGIYFRLSNGEHSREFNQIISTKKYNQYLDTDTVVAAVQSGKIPKFFLKTTWQPMTVLSLDSRVGLRHGKTAVYANCSDLIIEYSDAPSLLEQRKII